jgi:hypothetical protein
MNATYVWITLGVVAMFLVGLFGGLILFDTLSHKSAKKEPIPLLSKVATAPETLDLSKAPPVGLPPFRRMD